MDRQRLLLEFHSVTFCHSSVSFKLLPLAWCRSDTGPTSVVAILGWTVHIREGRAQLHSSVTLSDCLMLLSLSTSSWSLANRQSGSFTWAHAHWGEIKRAEKEMIPDCSLTIIVVNKVSVWSVLNCTFVHLELLAVTAHLESWYSLSLLISASVVWNKKKEPLVMLRMPYDSSSPSGFFIQRQSNVHKIHNLKREKWERI